MPPRSNERLAIQDRVVDENAAHMNLVEFAVFAKAMNGGKPIPKPAFDRQIVIDTSLTRVGLKPWPKLFQNLRASRQTELQETCPTYVVCAWMGNSPKVAQKHDLQVTEQHFEKAVQNPVQQPAANLENGQQIAVTLNEETPENTGNQHSTGFKGSGGGI